MSGIVRGEYWNTLDSPENLCSIVTKLPGNCRDRWNRKVLFLRKEKLREPHLDDLITFVNEEHNLASDPLFSREALEERNGRVNYSSSTLHKYLLRPCILMFNVSFVIAHMTSNHVICLKEVILKIRSIYNES